MKTKKAKSKRWVLPTVTFIVFLVFILVLFIQATYLAASPVVYGVNMKEFAESRNKVERTIPANRGSIFDSEGNILALNVASYTVIAYLDPSRTGNSKIPLHVVDVKKTAETLSPVLNMEVETLEELLTLDLYQVELGPGGRGITELKKDEVAALELPGISFIESYKRYYPNGDFASYIVGYAKDNDEGIISGELGIELLYDDDLKGVDGYTTFQQDQYGYKIPDTKETTVDAKNGNEIYLTLDATIQRFVEGAVKDAANKYNPEWLVYFVMDAKTGAILASSSTPSYDPNIKEITNYENPLTSYVYEPGSTMKTYTYMCWMEKGTYDGQAKYQSGKYKIGENTISDWNGYGWGEVTYDQGLAFSSNVAIANIMNKYLTKEELKTCLNNYGFGKTTGIELPRELKGSLNFNYEVEVATAGFGQGITTTPIQHLQALSMMSNNGKMLKPYIVDKIYDPNRKKVVYEGQKEETEVKISEKTIEKLKQLMHDTIYGTEAGTAGRIYKLDSVDFIAKTGTAEINQNGVYLTGVNDYIFSLEGMYPASDPEIIMYAAVKRPAWGKNQALAEINKTITESIVKYKSIEKVENTNNDKKHNLKSYINKDINEAKINLEALGLTPVILGDGAKVINQYPTPNMEVVVGDKILLLTNSNNITMPNLINWSRIDVISLANLLKINYQIEGNGFVYEQTIPPGTIITSDNIIGIKLKEKEHFTNITN